MNREAQFVSNVGTDRELLDAYSQAVSGVDDLHRLLTESQVGARSALTVLRGQELLSLGITPAEAGD